MDFLLFVLAAVFIEGVIEYFVAKQMEKYRSLIPYVALIFSILLCMAYDLDLFKALGYVAKWAFVGNIVTAMIISRGSNYLSDFMSQFGGNKKATPAS